MDEPFAVTISWDDALNAALDALAIPHTRGDTTIHVDMTPEIDAKLGDLVNRLSELRWYYTPGRTIQLELDMPGTEGRHAH